MPPDPPPLLLTKRLTAFLQANLSAQIQSALLITPSGKLLAYASPSPAAALRTQATVAAALWAIHAASAPGLTAAAAALPAADDDDDDDDDAGPPACITLALASGVVVVRRLACRLLFVCLGPGPAAAAPAPAASSAAAPADDDGALPAGSPSDAGSGVAPSFVLGGGVAAAAAGANSAAATAAMAVARRHAEELAKWLDDKLVGLSVPEEGIGVGVR